MKTILFILTVTAGLALAGSPERARLISRSYDQAYQQWIQDVRNAPDDNAQNAAWLRRPDEAEAGRKVWEEIRNDLEKSWTLEPAAWLLVNASTYAVKQVIRAPRRGAPTRPAGLIREAVRSHHLRSPKLGSYCIALTHIQDPRSMALLETVEKANPSEAVRGAAALAQAILHRRIGGGKRGMAIRQEKLRKAIVAPDLTVGRTTTQVIIKDELFRMSRLNLGAEAPDFTGVEVTLEKSSLSDYRGKVTILFFWHALMPAHDESLALMKKYQQDFAGKNIQILGVNMDNPRTLRKHIAEGTVNWKNFSDSTQSITKLYRVEQWPFVYVLDGEHKIRYSGEPGAFVKITAEDLARQIASGK
ncbi:peroxiredoxin family protein [Akkermansiaceae bacterium]|nr:peroxiredoxin family protein [Akkermansiaceae bacterium]MDB4466215.1 peroxiredoxin family protein [bacterium]MDB4489130.1 peroxiredoxin family protein [Akkermansiaceae bacterium]